MTQPVDRSPAPADDSTAGTPARSAPTDSAGSAIAAILAAGATAGLLPFELSPGQNSPTLLQLGSTSAALAARTRPGAGHVAPKPSPAGEGDGGTGPDAPPAPPGSVASGAAGAAPGGLSSGVWSDIFIVLLALTGQELRRHRVRPVLSGPIGVVSLLQRPG